MKLKGTLSLLGPTPSLKHGVMGPGGEEGLGSFLFPLAKGKGAGCVCNETQGCKVFGYRPSPLSGGSQHQLTTESPLNPT